MKITIKCPHCGLGKDVLMQDVEEPVFDEHYLDCWTDCPNCKRHIHIAITANPEMETEYPF